MPTTVYVDMPDLSGEAGPFYLFLRSKAGALLNSGGDQLSEVQVSAVNTGRWSATVAEAWTADLVARIYEGSSESAAAIVWTGWLPNGETELRAEYPASTGGLTSGQQSQLDRIEAASASISGARVLRSVGPVSPAGDITLIVGSDYVEDVSGSLTVTVTDPGAILHAKLTAGALSQLVFLASPKANAATASKVAGTITDVSEADGITSITIKIPRASIPDGPYSDDYKYQIWRVVGELVSPPLVQGKLILDWRA